MKKGDLKIKKKRAIIDLYTIFKKKKVEDYGFNNYEEIDAKFKIIEFFNEISKSDEIKNIKEHEESDDEFS